MPASGPDTLLLEYFTDANLLTWQARAKDAQDYHYLWFYELESQRATHQEEILDALQTVQGISVDLSGWGRAIAYKYSDTPLSCIGSLVWVGGRFNYGKDIDASRFTPFPALYLAEDLETGLREMRGLTRNDERAGLTAAELSLCTGASIRCISTRLRTHSFSRICCRRLVLRVCCSPQQEPVSAVSRYSLDSSGTPLPS